MGEYFRLGRKKKQWAGHAGAPPPPLLHKGFPSYYYLPGILNLVRVNVLFITTTVIVSPLTVIVP